MPQDEKITTIPVVGFDSIYSSLEMCSNSFFNKSVDRRKLAEKLANYGNVIAAYVEKQFAGVACYYANNHETKTAFLSVIVIRKEFQGCGIGSLLLHCVLEDAKTKGMIACRLEVDFRNENAIVFYSHKGFEKIGMASQTSFWYERRLCERQ